MISTMEAKLISKLKRGVVIVWLFGCLSQRQWTAVSQPKKELEEFVSEWAFEHNAINPYNSKANGKVMSACGRRNAVMPRYLTTLPTPRFGHQSGSAKG